MLSTEGFASPAPESSSNEPVKDKVEVSADPYVIIGPFNIAIVKQGEPKGYIRLSVVLQAPDTQTWEHVNLISPRLRSAFVIQLSSILAEFWLAGTEPDLANVRNIIQLIVNKELGSDKVKAVLMQSFFFAEADPQQKLDFS